MSARVGQPEGRRRAHDPQTPRRAFTAPRQLYVVLGDVVLHARGYDAHLARAAAYQPARDQSRVPRRTPPPPMRRLLSSAGRPLPSGVHWPARPQHAARTPVRPPPLLLQEKIGGFVVPVLRVSEAFCGRLYRKCSSALLPETDERVDLSFHDGVALCHGVGLRTVPPSAYAVAFSAGARTRPALASSFAALSAAAVWAAARARRPRRASRGG